MRKVFLIPNAVTAFGLTCGLFVIFKMSIADPTLNLFALLQASAILLLVAAAADLADGAIARMINAESDFGAQFDSLADVANFGIAPSLLVLKSLTGNGHVPSRIFTFFMIIATMIYSLCGVLRLVRFNVNKAKEKDEKAKLEAKKHFTGLPIPAAASAAISAAVFLLSPTMVERLTLNIRALILTICLVVLGYFMVSRWKFPSLKALHFRVPSFWLVFSTGVFAVLVLYGVLEYFAESYFIVSWGYIVIAWILSIIRVIAGKRSKTLADFEPDQDDENQ